LKRDNSKWRAASDSVFQALVTALNEGSKAKTGKDVGKLYELLDSLNFSALANMNPFLANIKKAQDLLSLQGNVTIDQCLQWFPVLTASLRVICNKSSVEVLMNGSWLKEQHGSPEELLLLPLILSILSGLKAVERCCSRLERQLMVACLTDLVLLLSFVVQGRRRKIVVTKNQSSPTL
jgi:hypothetical protein